jgi:hypothetical protein
MPTHRRHGASAGSSRQTVNVATRASWNEANGRNDLGNDSVIVRADQDRVNLTKQIVAQSSLGTQAHVAHRAHVSLDMKRETQRPLGQEPCSTTICRCGSGIVHPKGEDSQIFVEHGSCARSSSSRFGTVHAQCEITQLAARHLSSAVRKGAGGVHWHREDTQIGMRAVSFRMGEDRSKRASKLQPVRNVIPVSPAQMFAVFLVVTRSRCCLLLDSDLDTSMKAR